MSTDTTDVADTADPRVVYGALCAWWDTIDKVHLWLGLPACPVCHGPLFEMESLEVWWSGARIYAAGKGDTEYLAFLEWSRGKCFKSYAEARAAFEAVSA